jgi:hypothetical protein
VNTTDRILAVIDAGLQTPVPDPTFGEVSPAVDGGCARCGVEPAADSEFCGGCRAFLLGDSDVDPLAVRLPEVEAAGAALAQAFQTIGQAAVEVSRQVTAWFRGLSPEVREILVEYDRLCVTAQAIGLSRDRAQEILDEELDRAVETPEDARTALVRARVRIYAEALGPSGPIVPLDGLRWSDPERGDAPA